MESRRAFLGRCGAGAAAWTALGPAAGRGEGRHAGRGVRPRPAGRAGGVRHGAGQGRRRVLCRHPHQSLPRTVGPPAGPGRPRTGKPVEVPTVSDDGSFGFGLRVLADGAWGFSASYEVTRDAIARAAAEAVEIARPMPRSAAGRSSWRRRHPIATPTGRRSSPTPSPSRSSRSSSCSARRRGARSPASSRSSGWIDARLEDRFFASTEGSVIEQHIYQISP